MIKKNINIKIQDQVYDKVRKQTSLQVRILIYWEIRSIYWEVNRVIKKSINKD